MAARSARTRVGAALASLSLIVLLASCAVATGVSGSPHSRTAGAGATGGPPASGTTSDAAPSTSASTPRAVGPPYRVGVRSLSVVENGRYVNMGGHYVDRTLRTVIRYPARVGAAGAGNSFPVAGAFPLVVFAPGYLQCGSSYAPLLHSWAAAGFVVAEVTFPLTNCRTPDPDEADIVHQPYDVSYVIGRLLTASADPSSFLHGLIDPHKVAVAGHSDGGDDAVAVAADTCCRNHRVDAAVVLAGSELPSFGGSYFPAASPPMLFVQGTADTVNNPADTTQLYQADTAGPKALLSVNGAGHLSPYEGGGADEQLVDRVSTAFLRATLLGSRSAARSMVHAGDRSGQSTLTTSGLLPSTSGSSG